jgi:hypothetical protein
MRHHHLDLLGGQHGEESCDEGEDHCRQEEGACETQGSRPEEKEVAALRSSSDITWTPASGAIEVQSVGMTVGMTLQGVGVARQTVPSHQLIE